MLVTRPLSLCVTQLLFKYKKKQHRKWLVTYYAARKCFSFLKILENALRDTKKSTTRLINVECPPRHLKNDTMHNSNRVALRKLISLYTQTRMKQTSNVYNCTTRISNSMQRINENRNAFGKTRFRTEQK